MTRTSITAQTRAAERLFEAVILLSISRRLFEHDHYTTKQVLVVSSAHSRLQHLDRQCSRICVTDRTGLAGS
jgi:hypothetical protein